MDATIRAPAEHAVDGVAETAVVAHDSSFKVLLSVPADRNRCSRLNRHAYADSERASCGDAELHRFQVLVNRFCEFAKRNRLGILNLLSGDERICLACVTAVRAMARCWPLDSCTERDLEVLPTLALGTFPPDIAVLVGTNRNLDLASETLEGIQTERPHDVVSLRLSHQRSRSAMTRSPPHEKRRAAVRAAEGEASRVQFVA